MASKYTVSWTIDIEEGLSHRDAAQQALEAIRREGSIAHVFMVKAERLPRAVEVDLNEPDPHTLYKKPVTRKLIGKRSN